MNISPPAVAHPEAQISQNATIDPPAMIEEDVVIGNNCHIYSHIVISDGVRVDKNCNIFPGMVVAGIPQDMKLAGETTTAKIGDSTAFRKCVTINRGTASKGKTTIGRGYLIMAYSRAAHDCALKGHIIIGNVSRVVGEVEIDDFAIVSGDSSVHQSTRISKHVIVQDDSRVEKDTPPYTLIGRDPVIYCGINIVGLRRRGFANQQAFLIQGIYRMLYTRSSNNTEALKMVETEYEPSEERDLILNLIKLSSRDIVRGSIDE